MSRVEDAYRRVHGSPLGEDAADQPDSPPMIGLDRYQCENGTPVPPTTGPLSESIRRPEPKEGDVPRLDSSEPDRAERASVSRGGAALGSSAGAATEFDRRQAAVWQSAQFERPGDSPAEDPTTLLWSAIRVLARRKWSILGAFGLVATASLLYLRSIEPVFRATTRLVVELRTPADALLKPATDNGPQQGYVEAVVDLLRGRALAEATAAKLALWHRPEYARLAAPALEGDGQPPVAVIDHFMANTAIATVPASSVINVSVRSTDPELAASAANALAHGFIERDLESRLAGTREASTWLGRQLEEQRARVTKSEAALQQYREAQNATSLDDRQNIVVQRLADLNAAVTRARTERIAKGALLQRVGELQATPNLLDSVPAVAANGFIQQMKAQLDQVDRQLTEASATLGDRHPEIIRLTTAREEAARRLDVEIGTVAESLRNAFLTAQAEETSLSAALEAQKHEALALDRKAVDYAALLREAESDRALYQSLLEQAKSVGLASDLQRSHVRILDEARPPRVPTGPLRGTAMLLAVLASAAFAIGLGLVVEYLDPRLCSPDEVPQQLRVSLLGYLGLLRLGRGDGSRMLISESAPRFKEEMGRIRACVENEAGPNVGVLLITSAGPKEGKTLVATNLALGLAMAGRRVLLVDCDLRRSQVHSVFGVPLEPGLSTWLGSPQTVALDEVVRQGPSPRLSLLTAGAAPGNPAELLGGTAFAELLRAARAHYDWIVIDSPPVLPVSDTLVLAGLADHVAFVASADQTRRNAARLAITQLRRARGRLVGLVLNRVAIPRWGASYSPYYGGDYNLYYSPEQRSESGG